MATEQKTDKHDFFEDKGLYRRLDLGGRPIE
jgi:hypothetical protein